MKNKLNFKFGVDEEDPYKTPRPSRVRTPNIPASNGQKKRKSLTVPGAPEKRPRKSIKEINVVIENENENISNITHLLALFDQLKDFVTNKTTTDRNFNSKVDRYREKQRGILNKKITEVSGKLEDTGKSKELKDLIKNGSNGRVNIETVYSLIEELLGIKTISPMKLMKDLFPGINTQCYQQFLEILIIASNLKKKDDISFDDDGFILLSRFIYSWKTYSGNHSVFLDEIMKELKKLNCPKEILFWVDATPGEQRYQEVLRALGELSTTINLKGFYVPAMVVDDSAKQNEAFKYANKNNVLDTSYLKDDIILIKLKDKQGELLMKIKFEKATYKLKGKKKIFPGNFVKDEDDYELTVEQFYDLTCGEKSRSQTAPNEKTTTSTRGLLVNRTDIWVTLLKLFNKEEFFKDYNEGTPSFNDMDLCIKSNKTVMDIAKQLFAIDYSKDKNSGLVSVFNDFNAARIMKAVDKLGLVIVASKISLDVLSDPNRTQENIVIRRDLLNLLDRKLVNQPVILDDEDVTAISGVSTDDSLDARERWEQDEANSNPSVRSDGNCQFDSLALEYMRVNNLPMNKMNMFYYSDQIQSAIRNYIIQNYDFSFNFNGVDKQAQDEVDAFLGNLPQEGGWGNAATLGAYAILSGTHIIVHLPNGSVVNFFPNQYNGRAQMFHLYLENPGTRTGHYTPFNNTSFGKSKNISLKQIEALIKMIKKIK
jgi:hypothetical protein